MQVHANGLDFHVNRLRSGPAGDRPVVVCIHGLAVVDSAAACFTVGFDLAKDADVIVYDLRGHGRSQVVPSGYHVADHAADLVRLLDALAVTVPVHLVAFSYGGAIAMVAAMRHPQRVASVCLLDGAVPVTGWNKALGVVEQFQDWVAEARAQGMAGDEIERELIRKFTDRHGLTRRRATRLVRRTRHLLETTSMQDDIRSEPVYDDRDDYSSIECPVLGIYGDRSDMYWMTERLPALLDDVRIETIPGADHVDVYWHLDEIRPLVRRFVGLPT